MKKGFGYEYYIMYLSEKLSNNIINQNQFELLKMSYNNYAKFLYRLEREIDFKINIQNKYKEYLRTNNIDKILNDEDNIK